MHSSAASAVRGAREGDATRHFCWRAAMHLAAVPLTQAATTSALHSAVASAVQ